MAARPKPADSGHFSESKSRKIKTMNTQRKHFLLVATGLLSAGWGQVASAQLTLSFNNAPSDTRTVARGGSTLFNATLTNTTNNSLELLGIGVTFDNSFGDISWGDKPPATTLFETNFLTPSEFLSGSGTRTGNLFRADLISSPSQSVPTNYTGTVTVYYSVVGGNGATLSAYRGFTVQSTPSPPVVLVTLVGGIGAARMALRRRKTSV